jgi:serine/threonine protein kinase
MPSNPCIGDWIGNRYEIFDIHAGGMGVVFIVYDHWDESGRRVLALKTLRDEYLCDDRQIKRFSTECETWIKLGRHPHIVRAYSIQMIAHKPYAVLELVTGGDLRRWIGSSWLNLPQALRIGIQFCMAMEHALLKGLHCHRDIKPENLLITEGGMLKVTDFGLAKVRDEGVGPVSGRSLGAIPLTGDGDDPSGDDAPTNRSEGGPGVYGHAVPATRESVFLAALGLDIPAPAAGTTVDLPTTAAGRGPASPAATVDWSPSPQPDRPAPAVGAVPGTTAVEATKETMSAERPVTHDGAILGTGPYMAPEQFRNARKVDLLADIYSFGIVLFEMIATRPPFLGKTFAELAREHAHARPPSLVPYITGRHAKVAKTVDKIVRRCLAKDPLERFATFAELRLALSKVLWWATGEVVTPPTETEMDAWDLTSRGVSLATLGRFDEERESYEESIRVKPDFTPAWFNQAAVLGAQGHLVEAIEYADMALHLNPRSVPALINKGLALNALGRPQEAIACFDLATHIQPRDPEVWCGRVTVLLGQGNTEGARAALNQLHRLRPDHGEASSRFDTSPTGTGPWRLTSSPTAPQPTSPGGSSWLRTMPWVRRTEDTTSETNSGSS